MKDQEFKYWLVSARGLNKSTASSRVSNCATIELYEGDLDYIFDEDMYGNLLQKLTYTTKEKRAGLPAGHNIPINGDIYNGTATYKSAANLYLEFRRSVKDDTDSGCAHESNQDVYLGELIGGEGFLKEFDVPLKALSADPLFGVLIDHVDLLAAKNHVRPSAEATKTCIKTVFNEVEADQRFQAMGQISKKVMSWGKRKNSAYISAYYAIKLLLDEA